VNEGKPMNVRNSITSEDEKLANKQLKEQWDNIDWKEVEKLVNRLQIRITKAVKECKWYLIKKIATSVNTFVLCETVGNEKSNSE
jgi:RNA-directed DNA polymerase